MADFKSLNGYNVKDEIARNQVTTLENNVIEIINNMTESLDLSTLSYEGQLYFVSGSGYSQNIIKIDVSSIDNLDEYHYIKFLSIGTNKKEVFKMCFKSDGEKTLSPQFPCYAQTISGNTSITQYFGSIAFIVWVEDNKINIQAFNTPLKLVVKLENGIETSREITLDKNGSMIVSGGEAGLYTEFSGFELTKI